MVITRTPYRISFFGGGTDYPGWYLEHGGAVLSTSINKYCYLTARFLPPFFEHRFRIVYSRTESVQEIDEIKHPAVREILRWVNLGRGVELHHDGDLPARSGMGSSSSFVVGLLHALYALKGQLVSKRRLMMEGIHIEQNILKETVGSQDQTAAAFGGLNHIIFHTSGEIEVKPITLTCERIEALNSHLMLFYTGIKRTAQDVARSYVDDIAAKEKQLNTMRGLVDQAIDVLNGGGDIRAFGELQHEAWLVKSELSGSVSNGHVDEIYERALAAGAIGGKLTGAGGGGFMLLFAPPEKQARIREALAELISVPFRFEFAGSQLVFYDPQEDFSAIEQERNGRDIAAFRELDTTKESKI